MSKPINLLHPIPRPSNVMFALVAIGMYCNVELQKAKPGDVVIFHDTQSQWRKEKFTLVRKCKIAVNSAVFSFFAKSLYGDWVRIEDVLERWRGIYEREGSPFDESECLLIEVKPIKKDEDE